MIKFNIKFHEAMYDLVSDLGNRLDLPMADVIREALSLYGWIANEHAEGNKLLVQRGGEVTELVIPSLERLRSDRARKTEVVAASVAPASAEPSSVDRNRAPVGAAASGRTSTRLARSR